MLISSISISAVFVNSSPILLHLPSLDLSNSKISIIESLLDVISASPFSKSSSSSALLICSAFIPLKLLLGGLISAEGDI